MLLLLLLVTTPPPQFGERPVCLMAEGKKPRGAKTKALTAGQDNAGNETL